MLTKTQIKIMQVFLASVTKSFRSVDISNQLKIDNKNVRVSLKDLVQERLVSRNYDLYSLNYKQNHQKLAYIESLRSKEFLNHKKNKFVKLFIDDVLKKINNDFFVFIIFGSTVNETKPRDTDVLIIVKTKQELNKIEKVMDQIITNLNLDIHVHFQESVYEMFGKRDSPNLINQLLDKHLIFYGAETFYRMLARGRK